MARIFLMLCNDRTAAECFERKLFGSAMNPRVVQALRAVEVGDHGYLYHYELDTLFGPFRATTATTMNLEPNAWGGSYPVQFRVAWDELGEMRDALRVFSGLGINLSPLGREARFLVPSSPVLSGNQAEALVNAFKRETGSPSSSESESVPTEEPSPVVEGDVGQPAIQVDGLVSRILVGEVDRWIDKRIRSGIIGHSGQALKSLSGEVGENDYKEGETHITPEFETLFALLESETSLIFLGGRAGTGKSTLIKLIRERYRSRNIAVVAPTGIAALQAEGQTIHSFFRIAPELRDPTLVQALRDPTVIRELDLLIVDEVSMVRSDLLDAIDQSLKLNRKCPGKVFGGLQVLLVGDLFQLPPVVLSEERARFFGDPYNSPYFFSAQALRSEEMACIELTRVFRQKDRGFTDLLEQVRESVELESCVAELNRQVDRRERDNTAGSNSRLTLCCHNETANQINTKHLAELTARSQVYQATLENNFPEEKLPCPKELELKVGAYVMFCRNDPYDRWVNGTLGTVRTLNPDSAVVEIESGELLKVNPVTWENYEYGYNELTDRVIAQPVGKFTQLPLRLAWAVSIHKSQGLTLGQVEIDLGSGAFEFGQAYVALSRCRRLIGISLTRPINENDIRTDRRVSWFYRALRGLIGGEGDAAGRSAASPFSELNGGILIRFPEEVARKLAERAQREGRNVETLIADLVEEQFRPRW